MEIKTDDILLQQMLVDPSSRDDGFRMLMKQYGPRLYWHIRRIVVGHDDAEDVMQETCIRVLNRIDTFKGAGSMLMWLYRIATNEAIHHLRLQTRLFQRIDSLSESLTEKLIAECSVGDDEPEVLFQQALFRLPTQQRIVFNLRYYDELSYEEIARITGRSVNSLKTNYHYAVQRIKNYVIEQAR
ncbi:MAG: RNA polymerase sigma factor [Muribaculaceae bacterium]|nr:RNA polymerase sigma factor [Muribaculaceae bacterium]